MNNYLFLIIYMTIYPATNVDFLILEPEPLLSAKHCAGGLIYINSFNIYKKIVGKWGQFPTEHH